MIRRAELLIEDSRRETENEEVSDTIGIQDVEFIRYLNSAQERMQSLIAQKHQRINVVEESQSVVARQEEYNLPEDIYVDNRVTQVEYSSSGRTDDFFALDQGTMKERNSVTFGIPARYIRRGGKILLAPIPDEATGVLRISYVRRLNKVDIRRAKVASVTTVGSAITALTLSTTETLDKTTLDKQFPFFSVVDAEGNQTMRKVKYTNIDSSTGVVTIDPSFTFRSGETISVGDYLVSGPFGVNRSELPSICERYLIEYMNWKIFKRDSSADAQEAALELRAIEDEIIETFADTDDDIMRVPEIDRDIDILGPL